MNIYYPLLNMGIETGSIKTIVNTGETNSNEPTKRLGEVDYTTGRIFNLITAYSANRNRDININNSDKSHS